MTGLLKIKGKLFLLLQALTSSVHPACELWYSKTDLHQISTGRDLDSKTPYSGSNLFISISPNSQFPQLPRHSEVLKVGPL